MVDGMPGFSSGEAAQLRRKPASRRARVTIEAILDAADSLIAAEGAAALDTKRVADLAGISIGTVYNWFPDKGAISQALAMRYWHELADLVAGYAEAAEHERPGDPIGEAMQIVAAGFRARPGFMALWFGGLLTEAIRDATRAYRVQVAAAIAAILAQRYPRAEGESLIVVARTAVLLGDGILREAFRVDPDGDAVLLAEGRAALQAYVDARLGEPA